MGFGAKSATPPPIAAAIAIPPATMATFIHIGRVVGNALRSPREPPVPVITGCADAGFAGVDAGGAGLGPEGAIPG